MTRDPRSKASAVRFAAQAASPSRSGGIKIGVGGRDDGTMGSAGPAQLAEGGKLVSDRDQEGAATVTGDRLGGLQDGRDLVVGEPDRRHAAAGAARGARSSINQRPSGLSGS